MEKGPPILREGRNCWRIRKADRAAFLIDAARYFESLVSAVNQAEKSLYIAGWDIDSRVNLMRRCDHSGGALPLGKFLNEKVARTPGLNAHILLWDFSMIFALEREWLPLFKLGWKTHHRIHFRLDDEHPAGASHHQKIVVVDDALAFCGGIDLTKNRWDTPEHRIEDRRRAQPGGKPYGPFHDVQMVVDGDAAESLGDLFRDRWRWATGEALSPGAARSPMPWPENIKPELNDVQIGLTRTLPAFKGRPAVEEVKALYKDSIQSAGEHVYIETQYLTSAAMAASLAESLKQPKGPEIVIVLPEKSSGWLEQSTMDALRLRTLKGLFDVDRHHRLQAFYPSLKEGKAALFVHAKVMVVDDRLARVGSANLNNRSMGLDSECDICIEANNEASVAMGIAAFRNALLAEHLCTTPEAIDRTMKDTGSLLKTIELLSGDGRTLKPLPLDLEPSVDGAALVSDNSLLDPERPGELDRMIDQFVHEEESPSIKGRLLTVSLLLLVLFGLAAAWHWTPLSEWVSMKRLAVWAGSIKGSPLSVLLVMGAYSLGGLVMFPVTLLVGVTVVVFPPFLGGLYAWMGCLSSALVSYSLGAGLGKETIRRLPGRRINRLSRHLAKQGLLKVAVVRNLPVAPFTVVNMVAGASRINLKDYLLGTALGMFPGILALTVFADRIIEAVKNPHWANIAATAVLAFTLAIGIWWFRKRTSREN
jgi:phosphatidylserine/phosphatidylglycerophosphate/cardiolipin synthase-like enzyme/uncharacterized membrane protein YdjX (TVP38/TMEM64 family)